MQRFLKSAVNRFVKNRGYRIVPSLIDAQIFKRHLYSKNFQAIIDVGASTGETVADWLEKVPTAKIHAFEPLMEDGGALDVLQFENRERLRVWKLALSDEDGPTRFNYHSSHSTSSSLLARTEFSAQHLPFTKDEEIIEVEQARLDSLWAQLEIGENSKCLLKLDVQGVEDRVLRGAAQSLPKIGYILTEITLIPAYEGQCTFDKLHSTFSAFGFSLAGFVEQCHFEDGQPIYADIVYKRTGINW